MLKLKQVVLLNNNYKSSDDIIKDIKQFFAKDMEKSADMHSEFSDEVIKFAYNKLADSVKSIVEDEEDPLIIAAALEEYLKITKLINDKDVNRNNTLLRLFEQLNKYEQAKFY